MSERDKNFLIAAGMTVASFAVHSAGAPTFLWVWLLASASFHAGRGVEAVE